MNNPVLTLAKPDVKPNAEPIVVPATPATVVPAAVVPTATPAAAAKPAAPAAKPAKATPAGTAADVQPDPLLVSILSTKRAHGSPGDQNFRLWLHAELKKFGFPLTILKEGSIVVEVDKKSTTLFSCHVDTCHGQKESDGSKQALSYDEAFGHIFLTDKSKSGCLGGDDGVGVYLMMKMIKAKVKGSYIFHTGEECGGIGSKSALKTEEKWLKGFDRCIAFDRAVRPNESPEVIVTQGGTACASIAFGNAMVEALNAHTFEDKWVISHKGSFTDSKVYSVVISECINLGCFYVNQHSPNEVVDAFGVEQLLTACLKIKWGDLKASRTPTCELPAPTRPTGYFNTQRHIPGMPSKNVDHGYGYGFEGDDFDFPLPPKGGAVDDGYRFPGQAAAKPAAPAYTKPPAAVHSTHRTVFAEVLEYTKDEITDLIDSDPAVAADVLALLIAKYIGLRAQADAMEHMIGR